MPMKYALENSKKRRPFLFGSAVENEVLKLPGDDS
jgi:hypothetical protein